jgi:hypothetical protein
MTQHKSFEPETETEESAEVSVAEFERLLKGRWPQDSHHYHIVCRAGKWSLTVFKANPLESIAGLKAATLTELAKKLASGGGD